MSIFSALRNLLKSKEAHEMAPFIPYGSLAMGTLDKLNTVVHDANEGDPAALATVKAVKARADLGDPKAQQVAAVMLVTSKKQKSKRSLYARGMSVGHDPITFGAVRSHRGGAQGGGGVTVTTTTAPRPTGTVRDTGAIVDWRGGTPKQLYTYGTRPQAANWMNSVSMPTVVPVHPGGKPFTVSPGPGSAPVEPGDPSGGVDPYADPYGQGGGYQDPYGQYQLDPYGQMGGYGGGFPGYGDPYGGQYGYDPYGLGMPPGYGYEEPVIDRGGYQQYDEATDSFFSSNQKQVYDEATGMFYPAPSQNPYGF